MAGRKNAQGSGGGGCPDYMLTYGDMMSLLLCFFVMIVSLSQIKENETFRMALESLRKAFGYSSSPNVVPGEHPQTNAMSLIERIQQEIIQRNRKHEGRKGEDAREKSQIGKSTTVRNIRDGLKITVGGLALFDDGSAELLPEAKEDLLTVAKLIKGYHNKVLIRGHTSRAPLPQGSPFKDRMELSYARAHAVVEFLVASEVEERRLNIEACGANEPVKVYATGYASQAPNHRVEIIVKDTMVEDYEGDSAEAATGG